MLRLPEARALFHRAIMQSGGFGRGAYTSAMASERADQLLRLLDIDPQAADALTRLRAVEVPRVLAAQGELARINARFAQTTTMFMPVLPSAMSDAEMFGAIADGADGKAVLIGATADEVHAFFAANPAMQDPPNDAVVARFGGESMRWRGIAARRPGGSAMDLLADLGTDETFLLPAMQLAEAIARRGGSAYAYVFDWAPPGSRFRVVPLHRPAVCVRHVRRLVGCADAGGWRCGADGGIVGGDASCLDRIRSQRRPGARGVAGLAAA